MPHLARSRPPTEFASVRVIATSSSGAATWVGGEAARERLHGAMISGRPDSVGDSHILIPIIAFRVGRACQVSVRTCSQDVRPAHLV